MSWPKYVLLAFQALGVLLTVGQIGKVRKPLTPNIAAVSLIVSGVVAWLVVIA